LDSEKPSDGPGLEPVLLPQGLTLDQTAEELNVLRSLGQVKQSEQP
jgi:hypothetical protein